MRVITKNEKWEFLRMGVSFTNPPRWDPHHKDHIKVKISYLRITGYEMEPAMVYIGYINIMEKNMETTIV